MFERAEFEAMMTTTVTVSAWASFNGYGEPSFSTATVTYNAAIGTTPTVVMNFEGESVTPNTVLIVASTTLFSATDRFTLADGSSPVLQRIEQRYDDDGLHHQIVYLGGG